MNNQKQVKFIEKIGLLLFSLGGNVVYAFRNGYYLMFLTNILEIPTITAGVITTIGLIWDAVNDPLVGVFCANVKFKSGEVARPWLLISSLPWALTTVLLFVNFGLSKTWTLIVCLLIYFLYEIASTFRGIPYSLTSTLCSSNDEDRKSMNAFRSLGAALGTAVGSVAVLPIIRFFGGLNRGDKVLAPQDSMAILKSAIFMGVLCIVGCLIHYVTSKERVKQSEEVEEKVNLVQAYKMLWKCQTWKYNLVLTFCYNSCTTLLTGMVGYYSAYVLQNQGYSTLISLCYLIAMLLFSALAPVIDRVLGRRKTLVIAVAVEIIGKIPFMINPHSMINACINAFSLGMGATILFILMGVFSAKTTDIVEVQNGRRLDAMVSTGSSLVTKLGSAGMASVLTLVLGNAGFNATLGMSGQPTSAISAMCILMGLIPCLFHALTLFVIFKIDAEKEYEEAKLAR